MKNMNPEKLYKIEVYIPETHLESVKNAMFKAGAGKIGSYDRCCWETKGTGQFRALEESNPFIGTIGETEKVEEFKVEMVCSEDCIEEVISAMLTAHPYETPAYQYWDVNKLTQQSRNQITNYKL